MPRARRAGASSAPAGLKVRADGLAGAARHPAGAGSRRDREVLPQQPPAAVPSVEPRWVWLHVGAYLKQGRRAGWQYLGTCSHCRLAALPRAHDPGVCIAG